MNLPPLESIRDFLHAAVSSCPAVIAMTSPTRRTEDGGPVRQVMVALFIPLITAAVTALATAYVTQAVMENEIKQIKEEMTLLRETEREDYQRIEEWYMRERQK